MRLVIDTHIWVWWVTRHPKYVRLADHLNSLRPGDVGVSVVSPLELGVKHRKGGDIGFGLEIPIRRWFDMALSPDQVTVLPVSLAVALLAPELPSPVPADPMDRLIVATALVHGVPLLTRDKKLLPYTGVEHYQF